MSDSKGRLELGLINCLGLKEKGRGLAGATGGSQLQEGD